MREGASAADNQHKLLFLFPPQFWFPCSTLVFLYLVTNLTNRETLIFDGFPAVMPDLSRITTKMQVPLFSFHFPNNNIDIYPVPERQFSIRLKMQSLPSSRYCNARMCLYSSPDLHGFLIFIIICVYILCPETAVKYPPS